MPQAKQKFFDPTIFQKCWRGVGEQPTFAEQIVFTVCFPAAIAFFETCQFLIIDYFYETSCKPGQGNGAIAAGKKQVEPFAGCERPFSLREILLEIPPESSSARLGHIPSLPWESQLPLKPCILLQPSALKGNCDSSNFFLDFCFVSLYSFICFANVGYSPTPRQHFCKTAAPKNFSIACGSLFAVIVLKILQFFLDSRKKVCYTVRKPKIK